MPHAICSNFTCGYNIKLHDIESGLSRETPIECPCCASPMIAICPECRFLLTGNPLATHCSLPCRSKGCVCNKKDARSVLAGFCQLAGQGLVMFA
jgi:hypothetical protein